MESHSQLLAAEKARNSTQDANPPGPGHGSNLVEPVSPVGVAVLPDYTREHRQWADLVDPGSAPSPARLPGPLIYACTSFHSKRGHDVRSYPKHSKTPLIIITLHTAS